MQLTFFGGKEGWKKRGRGTRLCGGGCDLGSVVYGTPGGGPRSRWVSWRLYISIRFSCTSSSVHPVWAVSIGAGTRFIPIGSPPPGHFHAAARLQEDRAPMPSPGPRRLPWRVRWPRTAWRVASVRRLTWCGSVAVWSLVPALCHPLSSCRQPPALAPQRPLCRSSAASVTMASRLKALIDHPAGPRTGTFAVRLAATLPAGAPRWHGCSSLDGVGGPVCGLVGKQSCRLCCHGEPRRHVQQAAQRGWKVGANW